MNKILTIGLLILSSLSAVSLSLLGQTTNELTDKELLNKFISSKGIENVVVFDASNIKQYWVDNSVLADNNLINVHLELNNKTNLYESKPLFIQLINVKEDQDCHLDLIADNSDLSYSITNTKGNIVSPNPSKDVFIQKQIYSTSFHLEELQNFFRAPSAKGFSPSFAAFNIVFKSQTVSDIQFDKIILSFSHNNKSTFLSSPGEIKHTLNDISLDGQNKNDILIKNDGDDHSFSITRKAGVIYSNKKFYVSDNSIHNSVKLKNTGTETMSITFGYAPFTENGENIHCRVNPYKENKVLKVISSQDNSEKLVVDSYPEWEEKCFLALDAKEDLSDFPNFSLTDGAITSITKLYDGHAEIVLNKPIRKGNCFRWEAKQEEQKKSPPPKAI